MHAEHKTGHARVPSDGGRRWRTTLTGVASVRERDGELYATLCGPTPRFRAGRDGVTWRPAAVEAPVEEEAVTEAPAVAPVAAFKVGEIVTAGDGKSYVIIKVDASGISAMPLTAFTQYQEPAPTYKPVAKKKHKKRYSAYRNYGYSSDSCH